MIPDSTNDPSAATYTVTFADGTRETRDAATARPIYRSCSCGATGCPAVCVGEFVAMSEHEHVHEKRSELGKALDEFVEAVEAIRRTQRAPPRKRRCRAHKTMGCNHPLCR